MMRERAVQENQLVIWLFRMEDEQAREFARNALLSQRVCAAQAVNRCRNRMGAAA